jgi:serine/threonine protein kinase
MEYLPGMNLDQLVQMHGPLPAERVIHLLTQTCEALSEAHAQNLVHRDIKPANIFAAHRGGIYDVAKLLDFGLARPLVNLGGDDSSLTQEGTIAGSPLFMSPEQVSGEQPDERSDIYSLGIVAYYLLTGRVPFTSDKAIKVLIAHAHETPRPPSELNADVPRDLEEVVMRCLEKDPDHRYPDVESLRAALLDCESAGLWTRASAECWWQNHGCPKKRALDKQVFTQEPVSVAG